MVVLFINLTGHACKGFIQVPCCGNTVLCMCEEKNQPYSPERKKKRSTSAKKKSSNFLETKSSLRSTHLLYLCFTFQ